MEHLCVTALNEQSSDRGVASATARGELQRARLDLGAAELKLDLTERDNTREQISRVKSISGLTGIAEKARALSANLKMT